MRRVAQLGFLLLLSAGPALAQAPAGPLPPKPGAKPQLAPSKPQIRVKVDLVSTPVTVRDTSGELVLDLGERDFRVFDNRVEQKIEHFDLGGDPLSVVILLETSSRIEPMMEAIRRTGILFSQTVVGQTGEAAILGIDDATTVLLPFTTDPERIEKTVSTLRLGTSGLRLYDGLSQAVGLLRNRPTERRRVIVVVSEAADTDSENKLGAVLREAQLNNIALYSIGLSTTAALLRAEPKQPAPSPFPPGTFPTPGIPGRPQTPTTQQQERGNIDLLAAVIWLVQTASNAVREDALEVASAGTGGLHVGTFRERSIEKAIDQIGSELHAQYTLSYRPSGSDASGFHEIKVVVSRPGLKVRTRPGYYLAPPSS